jgi:riboflavin biosynthesis pyrimidine reductase
MSADNITGSQRPRVICHMAASLDGRMLVAREHEGDAAREDFCASGDFDSFAFAIDASGRLAWETNDIDGDHVVAILPERVSDEYLAFLRARGVSYILAGARDVDLPVALGKIGDRFGVKVLMLEGGGRINGGMLAAGLIDEVSVLVAPTVDGASERPRSSTSTAMASRRAASLSSTWSIARMTCFGCATASSRGPTGTDVRSCSREHRRSAPVQESLRARWRRFWRK